MSVVVLPSRDQAAVALLNVLKLRVEQGSVIGALMVHVPASLDRPEYFRTLFHDDPDPTVDAWVSGPGLRASLSEHLVAIALDMAAS